MAAAQHVKSMKSLAKDDVVIFAKDTVISKVAGDLTIVEGRPNPAKMADVTAFIAANDKNTSDKRHQNMSQIEELENARQATYEDCTINEVMGDQYEFRGSGDTPVPSSKTATSHLPPKYPVSEFTLPGHKERLYRGVVLKRIGGNHVIIRDG